MTSCCAYAHLSRFKLFLMELLAFGKKLLSLVFQLRKTKVKKKNWFIMKVPKRLFGIRDFLYLRLDIRALSYLRIGIRDFSLRLGIRDLSYMRLGIREFPYLRLGIGYFPYFRLGIWDFAAKSGRDSGLKVCTGGGMPHIATRLNEILGRDYGIEKPYRGPFMMFTFISENISENTVQRDSMTKKKEKKRKSICSPFDPFANV